MADAQHWLPGDWLVLKPEAERRGEGKGPCSSPALMDLLSAKNGGLLFLRGAPTCRNLLHKEPPPAGLSTPSQLVRSLESVSECSLTSILAAQPTPTPTVQTGPPPYYLHHLKCTREAELHIPETMRKS